MKKHYLIVTLLLLSVFTVFLSCGSDESEDYKEISPVVLDLTAVPYPKLSDYKFFEGEMKNLKPAYKVLPYDLNSSLFTDYALKKRFVWMPEGAQATYSSDGEVLNFPTGAVLIKNFYYDNVLPDNVTKIIETRIMIKKADGWIFANYKWNDEQTEAFLDMNGSNMNISWMQGNTTMYATYNIPDGEKCLRCHNINGTAVPIGTKPQNLNKKYTYDDSSINQLEKWKKEGYISNLIPSAITSTVNWEDTSLSLDLRVRSYLDINCAHCHSPEGDANEMPLYLAFTATTNPINMGVCLPVHEPAPEGQNYVVSAQNIYDSLLYYRMTNTRNKSDMMPPVGRSLSHIEATDMVAEWINAMPSPCP